MISCRSAAIVVWRWYRCGERTAVDAPGGPAEPDFQPVHVHVVVAPGYFVVAGEVGVPAAEPDEVGVNAAADGR